MKKILSFLYIILLAAILFTCSLDTTKTGSISLSFPMDQTRTLLPSISMEPESYDITGDGPGDSTFSLSSAQPQASISGLAFGSWDVAVNAKNADSTIIGQGFGTTIVHAGETSVLNITVTPLDGTGTLDLAVNWNAADTDYPTIQSQLVPVSGTPVDLGFTISGGNTGTYTNIAISTGYYSLIVKLMDGNPANTTPQLTMGAVEVVRIVKDQTTAGVFDFTKINIKTGTIQVNITPKMADPIVVNLSGCQNYLEVSESITVSASVSPDIGNVLFVWYINGEAKGTGESFVINDLSVGNYRLDVTAFTPDGSRAGSSMYCFEVKEHVIKIGTFGGIGSAFNAIIASDDFKTHFPDVPVIIYEGDFTSHHDRINSNIETETGVYDIECIENLYLAEIDDNRQLLTDLAYPPYNGLTQGQNLAQYALSTGVTRDGRLLGFPLDVAPAVLFYRKSIVDEAGVDLTNIPTWNDFIQKCQILTKDIDGDGQIDQYAVTHPIDIVMLTFGGGRGGWYNSMNEPYMPEEKFKNALQLAKDINDAGISADLEPWSPEWTNALKNGKVVTLCSGHWMAGHFMNWICPELSGDWRMTYLPCGIASSSGGTYLSIPALVPEEKKLLAWQVIKYLSTSPCAQLDYYKTSIGFPALTTVYNDSYMSEPCAFLGGQKIGEICRSIIPDIQTMIINKNDSEALNLFTQAVNSVIFDNVTVDEAYNTAKSSISAF